MLPVILACISTRKGGREGEEEGKGGGKEFILNILKEKSIQGVTVTIITAFGHLDERTL